MVKYTIMKTLIIHPKDESTDFLRPIYENLEHKTVIQADTSDSELRRLIEQHEQIIMLGHGTSFGLLNVANIGKSYFTINYSHVDLLRNKRCIFIWCNADQFVLQHQLKGLYTGMFISEESELICCKEGRAEEIDPSNRLFAEALGRCLLKYEADYQMIFEDVDHAYGELARENLVAAYNYNRWSII